MVHRQLTIALLIHQAFTIHARAQGVALRLGGGPAYASGIGVGGLVSLEVRRRAVILRGDGRFVSAGDKAQVAYGGAALGLATSKPGTAPSPYVLATLAKGYDIREGDLTTAIGVAVGVDTVRPGGLFAELRYEHSSPRQNPAPYYRLPRNQVTVSVGLRLGSS
jgi:hypothetical protein